MVRRVEPKRALKEIEKDEEYVATIAALGAEVEDLIKQNNAIDIYEEYFAGSQADHSSEQPYAKTLTVFRDPARSSEAPTTSAGQTWTTESARWRTASWVSRNSPRDEQKLVHLGRQLAQPTGL